MRKPGKKTTVGIMAMLVLVGGYIGLMRKEGKKPFEESLL